MSEKPSFPDPDQLSQSKAIKAYRQYSKEHMPEMRQQTLEAIRQQRQHRNQATEEQVRIDEKLLNNRQHIEHQGQQNLEAEQQAELLRIELNQRETSLLKTALDMLRPAHRQQLRQQHQLYQHNQQSAEKAILQLEYEYQQLVEQYQQLHRDKQQYNQLQWQHLNSHRFQAAEGLRRSKAEQDLLELESYKQEHGDIQHIMQEQNVYFTHGIWAVEMGQSSLFHTNATFTDKAGRIIAEQPQICASTVSPDTTLKRIWGRAGLFLNGGTIEHASPVDMQSTVDPQTMHRVFTQPSHTNVDQYKQALQESIDESRAKEYVQQKYTKQNEFIISNPNTAGVFIVLPSPKIYRNGGVVEQEITGHTLLENIAAPNGEGEEVFTIEDAFQSSQDLGLPVFAFYPDQPNLAYQIELDSQTGAVIKLAPYTPQQIAQLQSPQLSAEILDRVQAMAITPAEVLT